MQEKYTLIKQADFQWSLMNFICASAINHDITKVMGK
jgi:hypothetical protein